ncbi:hypothetical protein SM105_000871 [Cronobacter sakazakii]|nr:hypothetical protein [Cronobacter sakazakii]
MDKSREQFEEFAQREKLSLAYGDCGYVYTSTEMAWRAWQASRAAVEIDVPDASGYWNGSQGQEVLNHRQLIADICDSIRAAGLKVKGE